MGCIPLHWGFRVASQSQASTAVHAGRVAAEPFGKSFVIATTNSQHRFPIYTNVLEGVILKAPEQAWVGDLAYVRLRSAFVYLACFMDVFSSELQRASTGEDQSMSRFPFCL